MDQGLVKIFRGLGTTMCWYMIWEYVLCIYLYVYV